DWNGVDREQGGASSQHGDKYGEALDGQTDLQGFNGSTNRQTSRYIQQRRKDYGMTRMHGEEGREPPTEDGLLNPPDFLPPRTEAAMGMLTSHGEDFDCVLTRPTTLYGRSGISRGLGGI
ncbi:hypothetical protein CLAIMM_08497, partial [Cladophialophora immunda]